MKVIYYLETIAALGLKVALSIYLNELIKLSEYQRSRSSLTLVKGHSDFNVKTYFLQNTLGDLEPKFI